MCRTYKNRNRFSQENVQYATQFHKFPLIQMPNCTAISAATAFMAQIKDVGEWLPINLKYAALVHFVKMLDSPEVCTYIMK